MKLNKMFASLSVLIVLVSLVGIFPANAAPPNPPVISDDALKAISITLGGADVLPTTRTVAHWFGQTLDPSDGVTYGYNMVGADPYNCSGSDCSVTIETDITPIIVNIGGLTFDGTSVLQATLDSPQFANNDYATTPAATAAGSFPNAPALIRGPGGALSALNAGQQLQLQDATMRSQFNKGESYHLILHPNILPAVTLNVPSGGGVLLQSGRGVVFADVNVSWWGPQIQKLMQSADPTHLPFYLTSDVLLYSGNTSNCCIIGFHGASEVLGQGTGSGNGKGNQPVQTFAWASYVSAGIYARPNGGTDWALQDIHAVSHEIAEWADDPFVNNKVEPWLTPTAPQYGCTSVLETGDPVVGIGFAMGNNTYFQNPNPWTSPTNHTPSISYDGYYHPEDEALLPWFMRTAPNTISEPTQSPSTNVGRYTFMGDLNPFPGFRQPATGC